MYLFPVLDLSTVNRFRLTVDFNHSSGENTASFSVVSPDCEVRPLGIAFVNLPHCVRPAVVIKHGSEDVSLTMEYYSGPECKYLMSSHDVFVFERAHVYRLVLFVLFFPTYIFEGMCVRVCECVCV